MDSPTPLMPAHTVPPPGPMRLETDLRIALLMLNDVRYRAMEGLFGLRRDQVNLASLVLLGMVLHATHQRARSVVAGPALPPAGDAMLGISALRELTQAIAGPASRDTSLFGTLVAIAGVGAVGLPVARRSIRACEHGAQRFGSAFRHRYGVHAAAAAEKMSQLDLRR